MTRLEMALLMDSTRKLNILTRLEIDSTRTSKSRLDRGLVIIIWPLLVLSSMSKQYLSELTSTVALLFQRSLEWTNGTKHSCRRMFLYPRRPLWPVWRSSLVLSIDLWRRLIVPTEDDTILHEWTFGLLHTQNIIFHGCQNLSPVDQIVFLVFRVDHYIIHPSCFPNPPGFPLQTPPWHLGVNRTSGILQD